MTRVHWLAFALITLVVMGASCFKDTSYVPAGETTPPNVDPSLEGSRASTGGQSATITPTLATEKLVAALPQSSRTWAASEAHESKNPIPLPDGTRTEYTVVVREYQQTDTKGNTLRVTVTLADTRGLPALTAFLDGYEERTLDTGFRSRIPVGNIDGWITYTYGPNREADGVGSFVTLYRNRFLIQIDGSNGVSSEVLAQFAAAVDLTELN